MDLTQLIAAAWTDERDSGRYIIDEVRDDEGAITGFELQQYTDDEWMAYSVLHRGDYNACQAHLDSLCAAAVEKALKDAGIACVPVEPTEAMVDACHDADAVTGWRCNAGAVYRAMITAAQEADR